MPGWSYAVRAGWMVTVAALGAGATGGCGGTGLNLGAAADGGNNKTGPLTSDGGGSGGGNGITTDGSSGSDSGGCPIYQSKCGQSCIPVSNDPHNCGGCGVVCASGQVCSSSACSSGCLPGLTACSGACVDTQNDSANCGGCGAACSMGKGCVDGACIPSIGSVTSAACVGGGPPISLGSTTAGCVAQTTFTWALCSCRNIETSGTLLTDGFNSTTGPYTPGGVGGGVGVDDDFSSAGGTKVWGAFWASSSQGVGISGEIDVKQEMHVGGPLTCAGVTTLEDDAYVNGDVEASGAISVAHTLYVPATAMVEGVTYGAVVRQPVTVPPPCDCSPTGLLPVSAWIAAASPPNNDNATIGLDPGVLSTGGAEPARIDLPCGRFYLSGIQTSSGVTIAAHGNTALFIDGDVSAAGTLAFVLDPTAQFDVVIGGTIDTAGTVVIGSPDYPALSRTYLGGAASLSIAGSWSVGGNIYAAYSPVDIAGGEVMYGSLFAGDLSLAGGAKIHFDRAVVSGGLCGPPPPSTPPSTCTSCKDCGNQACVNGTCGACTSSDQCCAPLTCQNGQCGQNIE